MASEDRAETHDLTEQFLLEQDLARAGQITGVRRRDARAVGNPRLGKA
jgi:hypothetical protein